MAGSLLMALNILHAVQTTSIILHIECIVSLRSRAAWLCSLVPGKANFEVIVFLGRAEVWNLVAQQDGFVELLCSGLIFQSCCL